MLSELWKQSHLVLRQMILNYKKHKPNLGENVFIAHGALVIGKVSLGNNVGIWFNAVLRGDVEPITTCGKYLLDLSP